MALKRPPIVERLARVPYAGQVAAQLFAAGLAVEHALYAQVLRNPWSRARFRARLPSLTRPQQAALDDLATHGIAVLSVEDIGVPAESWSGLAALGQRFQREVARALERPGAVSLSWLSHNEERIRRYLTGGGRADDYLMKLHREGPTLRVNDPLLRFGLDPALLAVVNSYLGLFGKLIYVDMWQTLRADFDRRVGSQRWHRDYEDTRMVKAYVYLADVGPQAGPLEYVRGSQNGGKYWRLFSWRPSVSRYVAEGQVEERVVDSDRLTAIGKAGTLVLCDTSGLHRGGPTLEGERVLATWTFVTPASLHQRRFHVAPGGSWNDLGEDARFALS